MSKPGSSGSNLVVILVMCAAVLGIWYLGHQHEVRARTERAEKLQYLQEIERTNARAKEEGKRQEGIDKEVRHLEFDQTECTRRITELDNSIGELVARKASSEVVAKRVSNFEDLAAQEAELRAGIAWYENEIASKKVELQKQRERLTRIEADLEFIRRNNRLPDRPTAESTSNQQ